MQTLGRILLSRFTIAIIELLLVIPLVLAIREVSSQLFVNKAELHQEMDIVTGIGVILIGLGVVLEERHILREVFHNIGGKNEVWEESVDHLCHKYGTGQLVIGLVACICIEAIKIPNTILYTGEVDDYMVAVALAFLALGALLLTRSGITLLFFMSPPKSAVRQPSSH
jgi:hypothetical protein